MKGVWAVVPAKPFEQAKQRLSGLLPVAVRRELARAMLEDVLDSLSSVGRFAGIVVATTDPAVARVARGHGCEVFGEEPGGGLSAAVMAAARRLAAEGCGTVVAIPADVPGISARELEMLLERHGDGPGVTLVPAHDGGGTNAIVMTPPDAIELAYGENSFRRHLQAARRAGMEAAVLTLSGIAHDIDFPQDVALFMRHPSPTRAWRRLKTCFALSDDPLAA